MILSGVCRRRFFGAMLWPIPSSSVRVRASESHNNWTATKGSPQRHRTRVFQALRNGRVRLGVVGGEMGFPYIVADML